ncbi:hypothetical protein L6164_024980 [Bauhinia variegata]|uniref:Uncharacterized protein n=1 Tax=Bauhinia variegata TaxID=167791 RepID=A0ACB9M020_BAUVA|nr:hypothetical protein L6164_024980 [Bauhinia variegata]
MRLRISIIDGSSLVVRKFVNYLEEAFCGVLGYLIDALSHASNFAELDCAYWPCFLLPPVPTTPGMSVGYPRCIADKCLDKRRWVAIVIKFRVIFLDPRGIFCS